MSNNPNYIQTTENMQQTTKKYYSYLYELKHLPTGLLYVGSRSRKDVLKKFEDCYTDNYLGSSSKKEGPFSEKDTKINPQDYAKTVLNVFYDEDANKAWKNEHGSNGLIMTYWTIYGKDKVLNGHCFLNDGSKVFSTAGVNVYANKTEDELAEINQKQSDSHKKVHQNRTEEQKEEINQKRIDTWDNKSENEMAAINQKRNDTNNNKTVAEKAVINQKIRNGWDNQTPEKKEEISQKRKGENNPMFGQGYKVVGEKNGSKKLFQHPYDADFIGNGNKISHDIRKNYPNEKQWKDFSIEEKENFKII